MPPPYQQPQWNNFSAIPYQTQGPVGEAPDSWVARLGLVGVPNASSLPSHQLDRVGVRKICTNPNVDVLHAYVCVKEENKWLFDRLHEQKDAIEADFGAPMEWLRLDDKKASGIRFRKGFDGYNPESWPEMTQWLTEHLKRLEKTFAPRLAKLGKELKTGIEATFRSGPDLLSIPIAQE